jgi:hypothetical protein
MLSSSREPCKKVTAAWQSDWKCSKSTRLGRRPVQSHTRMEHSTFAWSTNTEHYNKHETSSSVSRAFSSSMDVVCELLHILHSYVCKIHAHL